MTNLTLLFVLQTVFFEGTDSLGEPNGLKHEDREKFTTEVEQVDTYGVGASDGRECTDVGISCSGASDKVESRLADGASFGNILDIFTAIPSI